MPKNTILEKTATVVNKTGKKGAKAGKIAASDWIDTIEGCLSVLDHILIRIALSIILIYDVSSYIFMKLR